MLRAVPVAMSTLAFFLIYRIVPHRRCRGGTRCWADWSPRCSSRSAKQLFRVYVHESPTYSRVYGAFAAVPLFLIWIYLSWLVVLFGAELTASAAFWRNGLWKHPPTPAMRFREAVVVVTQALLEASPTPVSFARLQEKTRLPAEEIEATLAQMVDAGILRRVGRNGYALAQGTRELLFAPRAQPAPEATKRRRGRGRSGRSAR